MGPDTAFEVDLLDFLSQVPCSFHHETNADHGI
jgi:hypothetical protein